jgi:type I restriction enzyme, S subunit
MSNLPIGWSSASVSDLFSKVVDGSHNPPGGVSDGIAMLSARNIHDDRIDFDEFRRISKEEFAIEDARTRIRPGDVLLTIVGTIGRTAVVPDSISSLALQRSVAVLTPRLKNPRFWMYQFQSPDIQHALFQKARGTAQKGVYLKVLGEIELLVAPVNEQERIVAEIEKQFTRLDAAVSGLKKVQANLKRYRASVLKAACEGRLVPTEAELARNEGRDYEPASALLKRVLTERRGKWEADQFQKMMMAGKPPKDNEWKNRYREPTPPNATDLPPISEGWTWTNLAQLKLFSLYGPRFSSDDYSETGIIVLRTTDISESGKVDMKSAPRIPLSDEELFKYRLTPGDIVFTRTGATVGKIALFNDEVQAIPGAYLIHYRLCGGSSLPHYVYRFFQSSTGQTSLIRGTLGIGQPNLNAPTIESIPIPLPPEQEQVRILSSLDLHLTGIEKARQEGLLTLDRCRALRQAVLISAFSGTLVPQDPSDEPASLLLERIRNHGQAADSQKKTSPPLKVNRRTSN